MKIAALACLLVPVLLAAQTPRDAAAPVPTGTAVISGVVVSDDASGTPVRRVVVTVASPGIRGDRRTVTDDQGRFAIGQLPAARYSLSATRPGWLTAYYGSSHPGRPAFGGASIEVKAGEQSPVTLKMLHGSALTGVVTDEFGHPASGVQVVLGAVRVQDGERRIATTNFGALDGSFSSPTDDRGVYRFYGIASGDYVVLAMPRFLAFGAEVEQTTADDLSAARRSVAASMPGGSSSGVSNAPAQTAAARPPTVGAASVYYPGTLDVATATVLRIGPNEERSGVDFALQLVPTARVQGVVIGIDGQPMPGAMVQLLSSSNDQPFFMGNSSTRTGSDGRFQFAGVQPGSYQATARAAEQTGAGRGAGGGVGGLSVANINGGVIVMNFAGPGQNAAALWASENVSVAGQDISGLTLALQRGATVSGHVVFTGTSLQAPQDLSRTRLTLMSAAGNVRPALGQINAQADASGAFHFADVPPGKYRVNALIANAGRGAGPGAAVVSGWRLLSAMSGEFDAVDRPIDVALNATPPEIVVTFTDHLGDISGAVKNAAGQPVTDYRIIVFSADKTLWGTTNRRMRAPVQTERDGTFRADNLPAGSYFLAAVTDMEPDDLTNMAFLDDLAAHAIPIALADGEKKVQEIRVK